MTESHLSTEDVIQRFRERLARTAAEPSQRARDIRATYLKAASVLHVFDLTKLEPIGAEPSPGGAAAWLIDDVTPAVGWAGTQQRTLRAEARREGLSLLGDRAACAAALSRAAEHEVTDVQRFFELWVSTGSLTPEGLSATEIAAVQTLCDWGLANWPGFPSRDEVEAAARRRRPVRDFEGLASGFVGRRAELDRLHEFIGFKPGSLLQRGLEFLTPWSGARAPLVVHGVGGVGKTALVARFILDYFDRGAPDDFPFIYLAFDDRALDPTDPITLVTASLHQIEMQITGISRRHVDDTGQSTESARQVESATSLLRERLERRQTLFQSLSGRASRAPSLAKRTTQAGDTDAELFRLFADLLRSMSEVSSGPAAGPAPFLIVLDTFEEVEYLGPGQLLSFWELVDALVTQVPELRLLIAGRSPPVSPRMI